jgi:hypothetical protein
MRVVVIGNLTPALLAESETERIDLPIFERWRAANLTQLDCLHRADERFVGVTGSRRAQMMLEFDWDYFQKNIKVMFAQKAQVPTVPVVAPVERRGQADEEDVLARLLDDDLPVGAESQPAGSQASCGNSIGDEDGDEDEEEDDDEEDDGDHDMDSYSFPVTLEQTGFPASNPDLVRELEALCESNLKYEEIRVRVCAINLEMNRRGIQAPAFRPSRKSRPKAPAAHERMLTRDRMLIDLHWLHSTGFRQRLSDKTFKKLLTGETFDFISASEFVTKKWATSTRVEKIMGLTEIEQVQMAVLVGRDVRFLRDGTLEIAERIGTGLRGLSQKRGRLQRDDLDDFVRLWVAERLACGGGQRSIAVVHGWIAGIEPRTAQTISAKLKRMRSWVQGIGEIKLSEKSPYKSLLATLLSA